MDVNSFDFFFAGEDAAAVNSYKAAVLSLLGRNHAA